MMTPTLSGTTLLYSATPLSYSATGAATLGNTADKFYFSGRSDNLDATQASTNPTNARLDPEALRVSKDGKSVFVSDEYGPYVYQFDRATGERIATFALPASTFGVTQLSSNGATEISGDTTGRVANKGMEGLAITPNGKTLVGFMQRPLLQDGGDGGRLSGEAALLAKAPTKTLFLDLKSALNAAGIASDRIPAKLEGLAFGDDVVVDGVLTHTLFIANDNDFIGSVDNPNQWFVFGVTDADLTKLDASHMPQQIAPIPEPQTYALMLAGLGVIGWVARRRKR